MPAKAMKLKYSAFDFIALATCFICIAWQSFFTIDRYLSYPIKVKTSYNRPAFVELPSASICIDFIPENLKIETLYPDIYKKKLAIEGTNSYRVWTKYLTVEQYMETTIFPSETISKCSVFAPNMTRLDCTDWTFQGTSRISWYWKCFTLFSEYQQLKHILVEDSDVNYYRTEELRGWPWFHFDVSTENYTRKMDSTVIGLSIHRNDIPMILNEGSKTFLKFDFSQYNQASLAYTRQVVRRLEAPYPTRCINYHEDGREIRRSKLVDQCARKKFYNNTGHFPCDILASDMTVYGETKFAAHIKGHEDSTQERYECNRQFPYPDCHVLNYLIDIKSIANAGDADDLISGSFRIAAFGPSEDTVTIREEAAFLAFDLYSYLGNLLSLWLGVSVSGIVRKTVRLVETRLDTKCSNHMKYPESSYYRYLGVQSSTMLWQSQTADIQLVNRWSRL
ncbi:hypothetical protein HDE_12182 [Halotydeus destructor]|nr:hypothetical protein HDE_12182 [Halotydeus destructor]